MLFEKTGAIGGVWRRGCHNREVCVQGNTVSSSSALNTAFSDFPIQVSGMEDICTFRGCTGLARGSKIKTNKIRPHVLHTHDRPPSPRRSTQDPIHSSLRKPSTCNTWKHTLRPTSCTSTSSLGTLCNDSGAALKIQVCAAPCSVIMN